MTATCDQPAPRPVSAGRSAFYRLPVDTAGSAREAEAHARADQRLRRQRDILRPLGLVVIAAVAIGAINGHPAPGVHGEGLGVAAAARRVRGGARLGCAEQLRRPRLDAAQTLVIAAMGAAGYRARRAAAAGVRPSSPAAQRSGWPSRDCHSPSASRWRLRRPQVSVSPGRSPAARRAAVLAAMLLCALLALVAYFIKQARASQDTAELLLAQLEDAREEQLQDGGGDRSAAGSPPSCTTCSPIRCPVRRSSCKGARKLAERENGEPAGAGRDRACRRARPRRPRQRPSGRRRAPRRGDSRASASSIRSSPSSAKTLHIGRDADVEGEHAPAPGRREPRALPRRPGGAHQRRPLRPGRRNDRRAPLRSGRTSLTVEDRLAAEAGRWR